MIKDFLILENRDLLIFFNNDESRIYKIETNYETISISAGGYGLEIDENMFIDNMQIYNNSTILNIKYADFISFVRNNVLDAAEAAGLSKCTRQNIKDLKDKGKLNTVKESSKYSLFLKSDVIKNA